MTLARWMAGWGACFVPAALAAAIALLSGSPDAWLVAWASSFSAGVFGLLGSFAGLALRQVAGAAAMAGLPAAILGFIGLIFVIGSGEPVLAATALVGFVLPPPIAAASTAWLLTRESHGAS